MASSATTEPFIWYLLPSLPSRVLRNHKPEQASLPGCPTLSLVKQLLLVSVSGVWEENVTSQKFDQKLNRFIRFNDVNAGCYREARLFPTRMCNFTL